MIASRRSPLARVQAELAGRALSRLHPNVPVEFRWIESEGDIHRDTLLADRGGKGLFTRAIEQSLLSGDADLAVHSMKDLPARDTPGLAIAAVPPREDPRDCLLSTAGCGCIAQLPHGAVVGTSSPRRTAQLRQLRPDLQIQLMRGNVDTRIAKLRADNGNPPAFDATLLAMAGLRRLKRREEANHPLSLDEMLPAAGQGALALQCRADDHVTLTRCLPLNEPATSTAVHVERSILAELGAGCHSPIAVHVEPGEARPRVGRQIPDAHYRLRVRVLSLDGQTCLTIDETSAGRDLRRLVERVVGQLREQGVDRLLHPQPEPETIRTPHHVPV